MFGISVDDPDAFPRADRDPYLDMLARFPPPMSADFPHASSMPCPSAFHRGLPGVGPGLGGVLDTELLEGRGCFEVWDAGLLCNFGSRTQLQSTHMGQGAYHVCLNGIMSSCISSGSS